MPAPVMSQLENTSAILGEYMLKGWTLTDLHCDKCRVTPLMREPNAIAERENRERIQFCALCDGRPESRVASTFQSRNIPSTSVSAPPAISRTQPQPVNSNERSINQADEAALSISELLLEGYSLLNDNCPNSTCKGIPLVGYPKKSNGLKDSRKLCVSCNSRWIDEDSVEKEGLKIINPSQTSSQGGKREEMQEVESPKSKARRELYGLDVKGKNKQIEKGLDSKEFEKYAEESVKRLKGDNLQDVEMEEEEDLQQEEDSSSHPNALRASASTHPLPHPRQINQPTPPSPTSPLGQALTSTSDSLSTTLQNLSSSLEKYTSHPPAQRRNGLGEEDNGKWFVDLKLHTEAIKDILGVLGQVERAKRVGY